jgi:hypothetical protein
MVPHSSVPACKTLVFGTIGQMRKLSNTQVISTQQPVSHALCVAQVYLASNMGLTHVLFC